MKLSFLSRIIFLLLISVSPLVYGRWWGNSSYQINQMNQMIQTMQQNERINQNILQMERTNQLIQMNQLEQMNQNLMQRQQIQYDLQQMHNMNQLLNIQQQLGKQNKARAITPKAAKSSTHRLNSKSKQGK